MKAAVVLAWGKTPVFRDFPDPLASAGKVCVTVTESALTNFTKLRAAGKHYSFDAPPPFVVGVDGVGRLEDGRRVYFLFPQPPYGGLAERTVVSRSHCIPVPENLDNVTGAAIAEPGMAAWVALEKRAQLVRGETVLVNGATGSAGSMAVQIAKYLGAAKVIATGRDPEALTNLRSIGADEVQSLHSDQPALEASFKKHFESGIHVVLDYLWGPSAEAIIAAAASQGAGVRTRFIQIGTTSAPTITLPGITLRSSALELLGSGIGSVTLEEILEVLSKLMQTASHANFQLKTETLPLDRVEEAWSRESNTPRIVFTMNSSSRSAPSLLC